MSKRKRKDWKYNGQEKKEELKIQWPRENKDKWNTMGATSLTELSTLQDKLSSSPVYRRVHVADLLVVCVSLFVLLSFFSLGHCIFSSSFFSWPLTPARPPFPITKCGPSRDERIKRKDWKYNDQEKKEGLKIQWPKEKGRAENTMSKRKRKDWKYNGQEG
jgi:hypothetical protein